MFLIAPSNQSENLLWAKSLPTHFFRILNIIPRVMSSDFRISPKHLFSWVLPRETEGERGDWNHSSALSAGEYTHYIAGKGYRESPTVAMSMQDI